MRPYTFPSTVVTNTCSEGTGVWELDDDTREDLRILRPAEVPSLHGLIRFRVGLAAHPAAASGSRTTTAVSRGRRAAQSSRFLSISRQPFRSRSRSWP
jgi:hypothetical protein